MRKEENRRETFTHIHSHSLTFSCLLYCRSHHDTYRHCLWRHHVHNPALLRKWETAVYDVLSTPRAPERLQAIELAVGQLIQRDRPPHHPFTHSTAHSNVRDTHAGAGDAGGGDGDRKDGAALGSNATAAGVGQDQAEAARHTEPLGDTGASGAQGMTQGLGNLRLNRTMVPPKRKYKIGLTTSLTPKAHSIFAAGIMQTVFFIYDLLTQEGRHEAVLVNLMKGSRENAPADWDLQERHMLVDFETSLKLSLDMYIEVRSAVCVCGCLCVFVWLCLRVFVVVPVYGCACVWLCLCVCACVCMCVRACVCVCSLLKLLTPVLCCIMTPFRLACS